MKQVFQDMRFLSGTGIIASLLVTGCVTSSDLAKLDQSVTKQLDTYSKNLRSEVGKLREQVATLRTETESLRAQVGTLQVNTTAGLDLVKEQGVVSQQVLSDLSSMTLSTKKTLESYGAREREHFSKFEEMTAENARDIRSMQQGLSSISSRLDHFPPLVSALGTEVRTLHETLRGNYELEEEGLRERLRAVEEMKKRFRSFEATRQTRGDVGK